MNSVKQYCEAEQAYFEFYVYIYLFIFGFVLKLFLAYLTVSH